MYLVGTPSRWSAEQAALLACGEAAVLSHGSAAAIWNIRPHLPQFLDISLTDGARRSRDGIVVHQSALTHDEVRTRHGLRVTSPLRTLLDLAATLDPADLERTVNEAQVLRLVGAHDLAVAGRHGAPKLRAAARIEPRITRSRLERAMLALVRRAGLPVPETSVLIHDQLVDFYWPDHRLVVETDGYDVHATRARFEADRARDARLVAAGYVVLRFTWRQLEEEPEVVAARLAAALALSASAA